MAGPRPRLAALPDAPRRGLALVRVSKARGREDLISPELQRSAIEDYAGRHGIEIVEWVEALDESASRSRSPWWQRLDDAVGKVERGERDVVLVWKVSRAARHRRRWAVALDRIEVAGGTLESATEGLDTTTSTGRLARGMLAELAAWEADVKSEQWKETHAHRRRQGLPHNAVVRLGYTYSKDSGYQPDPETAPLVEELYRRYINGQGYRTLAEWLGSRGIKSPRSGKDWTARGVAYYLNCGFAAGLFRANSELVAGAHPSLLPAGLWETYQQERARRGDVPPRTLGGTTRLAGMVRCGTCGYAMRSKAGRNGEGPGYLYICEELTCTWRASATRKRVEQTVKDWLQPLADDVTAHARGMQATVADRALARAEVTRLSREVGRLEEQLTRLTVKLAADLFSDSEYAAARAELLGQRDALTAELQRVQVHAAPELPDQETVRGLLDDWDTLPIATHRTLLRMLVGGVIATRKDSGKGADLQVLARWE